MLRYLPPELTSTQAVELLTSLASEADARHFLLEWVETGKLEAHHPPPPDGALVVGRDLRDIDFATSEMTLLVRYPADRNWPIFPTREWLRAVMPWRAKFTVSREQLVGLIKRASIAPIEAGRPVPKPLATRSPAPPVPLPAAVEPARGRVPESALRRWLDDYIREHNAAGMVPSREQMEKDARAAFEGKSIDRTLLRKLRPQEWRKSGRRNPGKKILAAELPK